MWISKWGGEGGGGGGGGVPACNEPAGCVSSPSIPSQRYQVLRRAALAVLGVGGMGASVAVACMCE